MPTLEKQHLEAFAQEIARGINKTAAYRTATGKNGSGAAVIAYKWLKQDKVRLRVEEIQTALRQGRTAVENEIAKEVAEKFRGQLMTMAERRAFLARCVRAQLHTLDLEKDGDLVQERTVTTTESGTTVKIKLPGKREAIMDDARLAGELVEKSDLNIGDQRKLSADQVAERLAVIQQRRADRMQTTGQS